MKLPVLLVVALLALRGLSAQPGGEPAAERLARFAEAEAAAGAGQDSLARVRYLESRLDGKGAEVADSLTALAYHRIATSYYNAAEDTLAMPYFRRSLTLRDRLFAGPHNERAHVRTNMGMSMYYYGDLDSALLLIQEATSLYEQLARPDTLNWLKSLNELGEHAIRMEDYSLGYSSSYRAIEICESLDSLDDFQRFITYYRAARILHNFGDHAAALVNAEKALRFTDGTAEPLSTAGCLNLIALIQHVLGETQESERSLQRSLATLEAVNGPSVHRADAHLYLAEYYGVQRQRHKREYHDARARKEYMLLPMGLGPYYDRIQLADISLETGEYAEALDMLNQTLGNLREREKKAPNDRLVQIINSLFLRARVLSALHRTSDAMQDYQEAFALQDRLRHQTNNSASRRYLSEDLRPDMDRAVALYYRQYVSEQHEQDLWEAFRLSERARAFSLLADRSRRVGDRKALSLQRNIAQLEREVARGEVSRQSELETLKLRLARLLRTRSEPDARAPNVDLESIRRVANQEQLYILEYHLSDSLNLAFLLSPTGELYQQRIPADSKLGELVIAWNEVIQQSAYRRKSLRSPTEQRHLDSLFVSLGTALSRTLLPADLLHHLPAAGRLCIVPDGMLNYLPFAALPLETPQTATLDYRKIHYLQDRASISYAYSGAFLAATQDTGTPTYQHDLLAFAPAFGVAGAAQESRSVVGTNEEPILQRLLYNQEEVWEIADVLPNARVFCGEEASRRAFLETVGGSRILHLSTHGVVNARQPELSFVAFNQLSGKVDETELLYFNDLYSLPIRNELTVLSACETSLGKLAPGEAPLSFASALAAAGARSTLTTLWQVDDRATKELMVEFYRRLVAGEDRIGALAGALHQLRQTDYFHPYYWGAPTLYGVTGTLELSAGSPTGTGFIWSFVGLGSLALAGLIAYFHHRKL